MKLASSFLSLIAVVAAVPAQDKAPQARQFLFDGYTTAMSIDMKKMRDSGVWDEISVSTLKMIFGMIEKQSGFSFETLDRVMMVREAVAEGQDKKSREVVTMETSAPLGEMRDQQFGRFSTAKVGDYTLMLDGWSQSDEAIVDVTPKLRVYGARSLLASVLQGEPRVGLPSGDVMSFTAAKKGLLGYIVGDLKNDEETRKVLDEALPDTVWPADDPPTFICIRLLATGDEDDPHLMLEAVMRHGKDGAGLVASEKAVTEALKKLAKLKEARIIRPLLKKVAHERDGTDAIWRVDIGRARNLGGMLGMLSPFMMFATASVAPVMQAGAVQVEVIEEVEVAEEAKPKPTKKKDKPKAIEVTRKPKPKPVTGGGR